MIVVALPVYFYYQSKAGWERFRTELRAAWWMLWYLPAMAMLSLLGGREFGGVGIIPNGWDLLSVVVVALLFYRWGVSSGQRTPYLNERGLSAVVDLPDEVASLAAERVG